MIKYFLTAVALSASTYMSLHSVRAELMPTMHFSADSERAAPGSNFVVRITIDSAAPVNAISGTVAYSSSTISLVSVNTSDSVLDFWQKAQGTTAGAIRLVGGSGDAFSGTGGKIALLTFRAVREGIAHIAFDDITLYAADGKGTPVKAQSAPLRISIYSFESGATSAPSEIEKDTIAPEITDAKIVYDPISRSNIAVFRITDDRSGVRAAEVRFLSWNGWSDWTLIGSAPTLARIPAEAFAVEIKTMDNSQNSSSVTLYAKDRITQFAALFLVVALLAIIAVAIYARRGWTSRVIVLY